MGREKPNYRDMIEFLAKDHPMLMTKGEVTKVLGISRPYLDKLIRKGRIKNVDSKIPIGSVASYLCG